VFREGLLLTAMLLLVIPASLSQQGLYGPPIPENTALLRVVNADDSQISHSVDIGYLSIKNIPFKEITPYRPISQGIYIASTASLQSEVILQPGAYYTIVLDHQGITSFRDEAHTDPARTQLYLYNLSSIPEISLTTTDGEIMVIEGVKKQSSSMVLVNPVPVQFQVVWNNDRTLSLPPIRLERGESFSIFVIGSTFEPAVVVQQAEVRMD